MYEKHEQDTSIERVLESAPVRELLGKHSGRISADRLRETIQQRAKEIDLELSKERHDVENDERALDLSRRSLEVALKSPLLPRLGRYGLFLLLGLAGVLGWATLFSPETLHLFVEIAAQPLAKQLKNDAGLTVLVTTIAAMLSGLLALYYLFDRWISAPRRRSALEHQFETAHFRAEYGDSLERYRVARDRQVLKVVIEAINNLAEDRYASPKIYVSDAVAIDRRTTGLGLSEVPERDNLAPTQPQQELLRFLNDLPGGSFGVSGPRGVGKSTLLSMICDGDLEIGDKKVLAINTAAPVEYDGRDFLLHLFSSLCRKVLERELRDPRIDREALLASPMEGWRADQVLRRARPLASFLFMLGLLFGTLSLGLSSWLSERPTAATSVVAGAQTKDSGKPAVNAPAQITSRPQGAKEAAKSVAAEQDAENKLRREAASRAELAKIFGPQLGTLGLFSLICLVGAATLFADTILGRLTRIAQRDRAIGLGFNPFSALLGVGARPRWMTPVVADSLAELRNIRFQRSFTAGWSGALKMPAMVEFGASGAMGFSQNPESLPELVDRFRRYAARMTRHYGRVVIGIDELDKLKSAKDAEAFLNSVKSVFSIKGCFYLISVSEHALASFERRGIGFRDAFDSALDLVLQVDYCDLAGSDALLRPRILRWPGPFLHLSHMLSGGLPRDLIRSAREILSLAQARGERGATIKMVADDIIAQEARAKVRATSIALRQIDENHDASDLMVRVARLLEFRNIAELGILVERFRSGLDAEANDTSPPGRSRLLCLELGVYLSMLAQIHRVASLTRTERGWNEVNATGLTEKVTQVRQALEASMPLAAARLVEADKAISSVERRLRPRSQRRSASKVA